jgi:hypothetical protein
MPSSSVVADQLNFTADEGAVRSLSFTLQDSATPPNNINLTGIVLEFVAESQDGTKVVSILTTDVSNPMGSLVIGTPATNGQVTLNLTGVATLAMYQARGGYVFWSLWYQPGTASAQSVVNGQLSVRRIAQP